MPITKLPILGIANVGKTSLILTLKREFKVLQKGLKPTKGIERTKLNYLDKEIIIWDFGGQEKYRSTYKAKANTYFSGVEELFFVVDFQDQLSFNESIKYFQELKDSIVEYSPEATINIIVNKFDPGFEEVPEHQKFYTAIKKKFIELVEPLKVRIYNTSIFNPINVIRAFSKPIFQNTILYDNFQILFMEFINREIGCEFIMIFTKDVLEIGNYFKETVNQQQMRDISVEIFKTFDKKKLDLSEVSLQTHNTTLHIISFIGGKETFYFTFGYQT